ncbi:MAG TPA: sensor histidine kinase [Micropepsaceae bacterium]|nr:sensor histidine kinase [Micropepsaceae bacterium]
MATPWMIARNSIQFRLIASAAIWTLAALIAAGFLLSNVFRESAERGLDDRLRADLENLIAAAEPAADGTLVVVRNYADPRHDTAFSGWYWQVRDNPAFAPVDQDDGRARTFLTSRSLWDQALMIVTADDAPQGAIRSGYIEGPEDQELRFIERDISFPDLTASGTSGEAATGAPRPRKHYLFTVAADRSATDTEIAGFNATLWAGLGVLGLGLVLATLLQVRIGLQPLRRMREALAQIRSGRTQRLEGEFGAEINPLATELNALVEHNAEIVARARTHVGNLAHALKTPLTILANEAQGQSGALAEIVSRQTTAMRRYVDHHLARARAAATAETIGSRTEVEPALDDLVRTLGRIHGRRGIDFETDVIGTLAFRGERQDFEELAGNLLDNAGKWAVSAVKVTAHAQGNRLIVTVEDDGPGLTPEQCARVLEKRERLDESVPGTGLGLGIVRDIARIYGGDLSLSRAELGGLKAELNLPLAAD